MKKYILFYFFTFQVATYAQNITISNPNFKTLPIDSDNSHEKELASSNSWSVNRLYFLKNQLKKLDVSQNIDFDYFVFTNKRIACVEGQKKLQGVC